MKIARKTAKVGIVKNPSCLHRLASAELLHAESSLACSHVGSLVLARVIRHENDKRRVPCRPARQVRHIKKAQIFPIPRGQPCLNESTKGHSEWREARKITSLGLGIRIVHLLGAALWEDSLSDRTIASHSTAFSGTRKLEMLWIGTRTGAYGQPQPARMLQWIEVAICCHLKVTCTTRAGPKKMPWH